MRSDYLFATPSTWSRIARLVNLCGVFDSYNDRATDDLADALAIYSN